MTPPPPAFLTAKDSTDISPLSFTPVVVPDPDVNDKVSDSGEVPIVLVEIAELSGLLLSEFVLEFELEENCRAGAIAVG